IQNWQSGNTLHLENMLVLPGLVNAHTHAAMTFLRGLADDMPLMDWLNQSIFPVEQKLTPEMVRLGSLLGYAEMLRTGTTACVDMYLFEESVFEAADTAGLRCLGGEAVFAFPSAAFPGPEAALDATRALAEKYRNH
ncbi:amidohydrolase family protein, partial [Salmonella enterica subsp. houtenae serovar 43:z4,z32:-]|nr:amidohydrolase family protein [Salmonella enterica subsp. houtenae serovar 43:z4,z32:-]